MKAEEHTLGKRNIYLQDERGVWWDMSREASV